MTKYLGNLTKNNCVIAISTTTSAAVDLQGLVICQLIIPSAFTGTAITFESSPDDGTYQALYNSSNTQLSITVGTSRTYNINPADFAGCRFLKIFSNDTETAARTIQIMTREAC